MMMYEDLGGPNLNLTPHMFKGVGSGSGGGDGDFSISAVVGVIVGVIVVLGSLAWVIWGH